LAGEVLGSAAAGVGPQGLGGPAPLGSESPTSEAARTAAAGAAYRGVPSALLEQCGEVKDGGGEGMEGGGEGGLRALGAF
jgi:hypothetical protein